MVPAVQKGEVGARPSPGAPSGGGRWGGGRTWRLEGSLGSQRARESPPQRAVAPGGMALENPGRSAPGDTLHCGCAEGPPGRGSWDRCWPHTPAGLPRGDTGSRSPRVSLEGLWVEEGISPLEPRAFFLPLLWLLSCLLTFTVL